MAGPKDVEAKILDLKSPLRVPTPMKGNDLRCRADDVCFKCAVDVSREASSCCKFCTIGLFTIYRFNTNIVYRFAHDIYYMSSSVASLGRLST